MYWAQRLNRVVKRFANLNLVGGCSEYIQLRDCKIPTPKTQNNIAAQNGRTTIESQGFIKTQEHLTTIDAL